MAANLRHKQLLRSKAEYACELGKLRSLRIVPVVSVAAAHKMVLQAAAGWLYDEPYHCRHADMSEDTCMAHQTRFTITAVPIYPLPGPLCGKSMVQTGARQRPRPSHGQYASCVTHNQQVEGRISCWPHRGPAVSGLLLTNQVSGLAGLQ